MNLVTWKLEDELPSEKGWYAIMRSDGTFCIRGWGNGHWWIPLKDGWMSGIPSGFKWFGPLEPIEWNTPQPTLPSDWQAQHLRQFMHNDGSGLVFGYDKEGIDRMLAAVPTLPEIMRIRGGFRDDYAQGWNDCLDTIEESMEGK